MLMVENTREILLLANVKVQVL